MYLKCDVLLLADVFKKFIKNSLRNYGLCSSHYLRTPALSLDPMPNMEKVELELSTDPDLYILFKKCMKDGVSYTSNKFRKGNNKYLKSYDPK